MSDKVEAIKKMEIEKLNSSGAGKFQHIKPFLPNDFSAIKMTKANGKVKYYKRYPEDEIRTCSDDLETRLIGLLEPLEIIEKALVLDEMIPYADSLTAIRQNIVNTIHEIFRFVNQIGEIQITSIRELEISSIYRWGQYVNAELLPPDKFSEEPTFDHDPELIESLKQIPPDKTDTIKDILQHIKQGRTIQWDVARG